MAKKYCYTTEGSVRGWCGHRHRTAQAAVECIRRDQSGCASQGGYSDREVMVMDPDCWGDGVRPMTDDEYDDYCRAIDA